MQPDHIVVLGASAGGVTPLKELFRGIPADVPVAFFVVLHVPSYSESQLPAVLNAVSRLPAHHPLGMERIECGKIYVAPSNRHLVIEDSSVVLNTAPKENRTRPAINPLFRSAAANYGSRVIGIVLSGILDDGTAGLWEIKKRGGIAVVQSPSDALHPEMPKSAIENVAVDYVVPVGKMPELLELLCTPEVKL